MLSHQLRGEDGGVERGETDPAAAENFFELAETLPLQMAAETRVQIIHSADRRFVEERLGARWPQRVHEEEMLAGEQLRGGDEALREERIIQ